MKKYFKLTLIFFFVFLITGCVKYNIGINIKKNEFQIDIIAAINKNNYKEEELNSQKKAAKNKGFKVEEYKNKESDKEYIGYRYTKTYKGINKYSTNKEITVELTDILDEKREEPKYYFYKEKSFFKTIYFANFSIDLSEYKKITIVDPDLSFKLTGIKTLNNNATTITEDGKTHTWKLKNDINNINFSFKKYNTFNIVITIILSLIFIGVIIFAVIYIIKKKSNKNSENESIKFSMPTDIKTNLDNPISMNNSFSQNDMKDMLKPKNKLKFKNEEVDSDEKK